MIKDKVAEINENTKLNNVQNISLIDMWIGLNTNAAYGFWVLDFTFEFFLEFFSM